MTLDAFISELERRGLELQNGTNEEGEEYADILNAEKDVVWWTWGQVDADASTFATFEDILAELEEHPRD